ncbi:MULTISPECIES: polymer-forming cytoskeletal protein [unclassified Thioalkalivibrio]|uniref:bactofilin family protein n=1 Tax=unclassified Thioalkalivibrio TaxID=2621013 RepID=UPI0003667FF3|nr:MULTISPECIES: polymer-forming cytoskeletal protein [unclassified Thioalkalivibrio]
MIGRKKGRGSKRTRRVDTMIGENAVVRGELEFSGGLYVEGRVVGSIRAPSDPSAVLMVAPQGVVEGQVMVPHLVVNGEVRGDMHMSEYVELGATARLHGHLYYKSLQITEGASIDGQLERMEEPLQGELEELPVEEGEPQTAVS